MQSTLETQKGHEYMICSLDWFHRMLPAGVRAKDRSFNPVWTPLIYGYHRSVKAFAGQGINIIMDHILSKKDRVFDFLKTFKAFDVTLVGLVCDLEKLEKRERKRKNRERGLAKWQFNRIHSCLEYDILVDTGSYSIHECTSYICRKLDGPGKGDAFKNLIETYKLQTDYPGHFTK